MHSPKVVTYNIKNYPTLKKIPGFRWVHKKVLLSIKEINNFNIINLHQQVEKKDLLSNSFYDNMTLILKLRKDDTRKKNYKPLSFGNTSLVYLRNAKVVLTLKNLILKFATLNRLKRKAT